MGRGGSGMSADEGRACSLRLTKRLMRQAALRARPRRRRMPSDTGVRSTNAVAANGLNRTFDAASTNRKWVAGYTGPPKAGSPSPRAWISSRGGW